ncbi:fkbM [Scenedesmus sp. PABB004]|nr:fkbM [Scenedesmus sp. PABB004]
MLELEAQKLPADGWQELLAAPGTHWRLVFTANEKQVAAAKKQQPSKGGLYFPIAACQKFDAARADFENGVFLGPLASLTFNGPYAVRGRQLSFDVVAMNVRLGPWRFSWPIKKEPKAVADMDPAEAKKLPFFLYAYVDRDIVVGRGRSGGLAVWTRATQDWEARAGVLAVYNGERVSTPESSYVLEAGMGGKPRPPPRLRAFSDAALPGLELLAVSHADAAAEAVSNRDNQIYFDQGAIALRPGDVVLDCGANVGSFARMAAPVVGEAGTVYAIEPIPDVCDALEANAARYAAWAAARGLKVARIVPVRAGVGDAGSRPARAFVYYPRLTAMSTMYPDDADAAAATLVLHRPQSFSRLEDVGKALARCSPSLYRCIHSLAFRALLLRPAESLVCRMVTVSELIAEHGIKCAPRAAPPAVRRGRAAERGVRARPGRPTGPAAPRPRREVGLLKINVERAEWDVLAGVDDRDWPKIRQVSAQVHDIDGRVGRTCALLRGKGFAVDVTQEPRFRACNLHMIYAYRPAAG